MSYPAFDPQPQGIVHRTLAGISFPTLIG